METSWLQFIIYQILQNARDKDFFKSAIITYDDVHLLLKTIHTYGLQDEEIKDGCQVAEIFAVKAITSEGRTLEDEETKDLIEAEGKIEEKNEDSSLSIVSENIGTLQKLTKIMIEYERLHPPSEKVFALLAFEADYIMKQYIKHPQAIKDDFGVKSQSPELNKIPKELAASYVQFQYLLSKTFPFEQYETTEMIPQVIK